MGEKRAKKMTYKQIKVLLIEDEPGDARLIREMMLDLGPPDSSGLDTFIKVHAQVPNVPIIMLTGLEDAQYASTSC
jgi:FixJ family two-component response regulator